MTKTMRYSVWSFVQRLWKGMYYLLAAIFPELIGPYYTLMNELYDYFKTQTVVGGELEGFMIYRGRPRTTALFFPCLIIEIVRTNEDDMFGGEYIEGATVNIEIMFTKKNSVKLELTR
jgi:hypothetical protein